MRPWLQHLTSLHTRRPGQESQVVKKTILIDGVLFPHRSAFKPGDNAGKDGGELKRSWEKLSESRSGAVKSLIYAALYDHFKMSQPRGTQKKTRRVLTRSSLVRQSEG